MDVTVAICKYFLFFYLFSDSSYHILYPGFNMPEYRQNHFFDNRHSSREIPDKAVDTISRIKINPFSKYVGGFMSIGAPNTAHFLERESESRAQAAAMREELLDFFGAGQPGEQPRARATLLPAFKQTFAFANMNLGLGSRT
jgi:hypothetical protein